MDREVLMLHLRQTFEGTPSERRTVARAAGDLADSGTFSEDFDDELSPSIVLENLTDAPDGGVAERWNWWMGALETSHGGYREFRVKAWARE